MNSNFNFNEFMDNELKQIIVNIKHENNKESNPDIKQLINKYLQIQYSLNGLNNFTISDQYLNELNNKLALQNINIKISTYKLTSKTTDELKNEYEYFLNNDTLPFELKTEIQLVYLYFLNNAHKKEQEKIKELTITEDNSNKIEDENVFDNPIDNPEKEDEKKNNIEKTETIPSKTYDSKTMLAYNSLINEINAIKKFKNYNVGTTLNPENEELKNRKKYVQASINKLPKELQDKLNIMLNGNNSQSIDQNTITEIDDKTKAIAYDAQNRFYNMSKTKRAMAKINGQYKKFKNLWEKLSSVQLSEEELANATEQLDTMFRSQKL